ncbi:MAG: histidinol dehydrogenase [Anaerolineaceae bacterium]|nr:histidinol dehydrogenase [Anaerolineaceae bacterium]
MIMQIYEPGQAKESILKRVTAGSAFTPQAILDSIEALMGEALAPGEMVARILEDVCIHGDEALRTWSERLDGIRPGAFRVPQEDIDRALNEIPAELRESMEAAALRIEEFHCRQPLHPWLTQEMGGSIGQLIRPLRRVGVYVPGGSAPLPSTILMSAIPAHVAGVKEVAIITPARRGTGRISPVILAAAALAEVEEVYIGGGAQAIAALAYGTESIAAVDKVVGPGNLFVTLAKQQVFGVVGIDGLAGPTETVVIADDSARPEWVAADLLAQAEHDPMAAAILLTPSRPLAEAVQQAVEERVEELKAMPDGRMHILEASLAGRGGIVVTASLEEAIALSNAYGPEHLNLVTEDACRWVEGITSAGGIFVGEHSYEVLGDYAAGPSHVMPTGGTAHFSSPLNVWDFVRTISLISLDPATARRIGKDAALIARAEGLVSHAHAAELRQNPTAEELEAEQKPRKDCKPS